MDKIKGQGKRRSQWRIVVRCLGLLRRLMREPATSAELVAIVRHEANENDEFPDDTALLKRLEEDRRRLRETFRCELDFDRSTSTYTLLSIGQPLFDLSSDAMRGLAFLQVTFDDTSPMAQEVNSLIETLKRIIPHERHTQLVSMRGLVELDLRALDDDNIADEVWERIERSIERHQQLEFWYLSPSQPDEQPRRHRVEPQRLFFRDGHFYLSAFCIETDGPLGRRTQQKMMPPYRLGRIFQPHILPTKFTPGSHTPRPDELVHQLDAAIARRGVTRRFANMIIEAQADGSAIVKAVSYDLFMDLRTLLKYGPGCRVLGGEEALTQMKTLVTKLYQRYQEG